MPAAAITSLSPNHGLTATSVVIAGSNLGSGGTVRFGATTAATTAWSATQVTATVPSGLAPGAATVTVTPTGAAATNGLDPVDAPTAPVPVPAAAITSLSPNHGLTATSVVIAGSNLGSGGTVRFGATTRHHRLERDAGHRHGARPRPRGRHRDRDADRRRGPNGLVYTVDAPTAPVPGVDTVAPTTRALGPCQVRRYQTARLRFQVNDPAPTGGTAAVVITIKNRRGAVVKVLKLGSRPVNTPLAATFKCSLRLGTYRFYVQATDAAGHRQANIASQKLTVYRASSDREGDD